ncbi:MAG: DUF1844 domain-containing protein [Acidobacteria bacterium]|nr:DUF1844 domain-containing protein [Acidobacteriota bacterium]
MTEEKEPGGFKITDRRQFTSEGELRQDAVKLPREEKRTDEKRPPESRRAAPSQPGEPRGTPPQIDFASFVLSLATTAMVHLGEVPDPATGRKNDNLDAAGEMIEILEMLQAKTSGNCSADEGQLLESLLYELRMKFLQKSKAIKL